MSNVNQAVIIYISAAGDLMVERETLARMIAQLPVTLAWRIVQSPLEAEPVDLAALQTAALHFLLMGEDIRAPVGLEWQMAQYAGRNSQAYLKKGPARTPAGHSFIKEARANWRLFKDAAQLSRQVQQTVIDHLLTYQRHYALTPLEVENLETLQAEATTEQERSSDARQVDAGHSAVVLSRERYEPSEGILIE